jgi:hypothetical protein
MSRASFGIVIDTLLTPDNVRTPMAVDPMDIVAELCRRGSDLSRDEVDVFCAGPMPVYGCRKKRARKESHRSTEDRASSGAKENGHVY